MAAPVRHGLAPQALHTAAADIRESLEQLRYYRKHIFKQPMRRDLGVVASAEQLH